MEKDDAGRGGNQKTDSVTESGALRLQRNWDCHLKKCSGLVHWEDPEGWGGEGGGRWDRDGEYM